MLDINLFRVDKGGDPDLVRESQRRRNPAKVGDVDRVIQFDEEWRKARYECDTLGRERNKINASIKDLKMKARKDPSFEGSEEETRLKEEKQEVEQKEKEAKERVVDATEKRDTLLRNMGNLVHESVPVAVDEEKNTVERFWPPSGEMPKVGGQGRNHVDLLHMIDGVDYTRGATVAGSRGYFLKGPGVMLNVALIQYGLKFLAEKGYTALQTPYFMEKEQMAKCAQLDDFDEQLYKVSGDGEKYLIATSEQPLCAYHVNDWILEKSLPLKYVGYSTCFRKEAGSHGKDQLGIFRVHQFEKLEQFCVTSPEDNASWAMLEDMMKNAEEFYQSIGLPYRVVNIVSGALNNAAAKKYDLEAWFPGAGAGSDGGEAVGAFRELVSCSNCTDYQSRRLETRCGTKKLNDTNKRYVHMLNSTLCATTRVICCILETFQTDTGIRVPEILQPFLGRDFIPFVQDPPKLKVSKSSKKKGGKQANGKKP
eukprot:Plantae.Rhodophyta-Hildenbrandia_rubra.ctg7950.p1 GENE.Plantae.Rhodophyta-Hildenbrandia_rubra.ctg7950~~Plantae.Rhodophyta-Hildenbrandia_rubra.ctg7950.p1  ORF type:complete len:481 (-),score=100.14 Plantae.Rhodophyta-Hildenbrandia_rubra.ctg7950:314-1756(-)